MARTLMQSVSMLMAALLVAICGSTAPALADGAMAIEGLQRVDDSLFEEQLKLFDRQVEYSKEVTAVQAAGSALVRTLYDTGFFDDIRLEQVENQYKVVVRERPIVTGVSVEGIEELDEDVESKAILVQPGEFYDAQKLLDTRRALLDAYTEEGVQDVEIRAVTEYTAGAVLVRIEVEEHDKVLIRSIAFVGNTHFEDADLLGRLQSKPRNAISWLTSGGVYDPNILGLDAQRVDASYQEQGYLKVQVQPPVVTWSEDRRWVDMVISLQENTRYRLGEVTFSGDLIFSQPLLRDQLDLDKGDWANRFKIEETIQTVVDLYGDLGFAFARVVPNFQFDEDENIVHINYEISKGKPVYFRLIRVRGNTKTRDKVVRREMLVEEGQLFNGKRLRQSRERVFALGFFGDVSMSTRAYGPEQLDLTVLVQEKSTGTVSAGLGFSSVDSFVGTLKLNFGNLLGYGIRLDLNAEIGGKRRSFNVSYLDPYFLDTRMSFGIDLFYDQQEYFLSGLSDETYKQIRYGGQLTLGYLIGLYTRAFIGYRYEFVKLSSDIFNSTIFTQGGKTSSLQFTLRRDTKNHAYDPTSGNIHMARAEVAGGVLGGDFVFEKYTGLSQWFFNPFWKIVLMLRGEVGFISSRDQERIPFAERYFLGGIYSVRGYQSRSIGPSRTYVSNLSDPLGSSQELVVGGNKQFFANAEIIFPILPQAGIKGVLFFDGGNTWIEEESYFGSPLRYGYGFGIRWFSPIGPLRFEWGYPIFPEVGQRKSVFEFTIGTFF